MSKDYLSYEDVYEIAAEVAEDTITKFLKNLVKLVPKSEEVVDEIQERQFRDLRNMRSQNSNFTQTPITTQQNLQESFTPNIPEEPEQDDFDAIAHPQSNTATDKSIFDMLSQLPGNDADMAAVLKDNN